MARGRDREGAGLWAHHHEQFRDPRQIVAQWADASRIQPHLLRFQIRGAFWDALAAARATLLVTREYEHLVMALSVQNGKPVVSYMRIPHPSGLAVDRRRAVVHLASTRNPNQVHELLPATGVLARTDVRTPPPEGHPLIPVRSCTLPGSFYIHDLALVGGQLHAAAVGHNAVVRLTPDGRARRVWWPRCIEREQGPEFSRNRLQLNSIGAGATIRSSFFSASSDRPTSRSPGDPLYPVKRRGVIFSGATRAPVVRGLTRPHSVRLHRGRTWVDNSGYGELGFADGATFRPVVRLPGWTRGLCFCRSVAFVGTSRVIPRFRSYAPGLDVRASECAVHAVDLRSGRTIGSLAWPAGNQIFAIEWIPARITAGFPFVHGKRQDDARVRSLFYRFTTSLTTERAP